jgi:hypothetical protein
MGISNFPSVIQNAIQDNFLEKALKECLTSNTAFRAIADREKFAVGIGESLTKTRAGLLIPTTTPLDPSTNIALDNGLTPQNWTIEQYTLTIYAYGATMDLNMETSRVGIAELFDENNTKLVIQAKQSLDRLARNALYTTYLGANSFVTTTLGAAAASLHVDSVIGFETVLVNGVMVPVSSTNPMTVTVGADVYTLVGTARDTTNTSTLAAFGGVSGTLTVSSNVTVADGTAGNAVVSSVAPSIMRPNNRAGTPQLVTGDQLGIQLVLAAVAQLRDNNVPDIEGCYNCFLDNATMLELFSDPDFKLLYRGAYNSEEYKKGQVVELLGVRFVPTNEAPQQTLALTGKRIRRAIICGKGALIEGDYAGLGYSDLDTDKGQSVQRMNEEICLVIRQPLDRFQEIISQSWKWRGGFCVPTDVTANPLVIPTATNSYWKRAVVIECV